jgi:hypothetical protein
MRVAVCLSGQPRSVRKTFNSIFENIIKINNADVFIHMNYDEDNTYIEKTHLNDNCHYTENMIDVVRELYKPVRMLVEKPCDFYNPTLKSPHIRTLRIQNANHHKNMSLEQTERHMLKQMISMFYSIFKCNELKEKYALENGFVYDFVIRLRFDAIIRKPLYFEFLKKDYIYYQSLGQPDELISDWINVGSNCIMNVYSSIYLNLEYLNSFKYYKKQDRKPNTYDQSNECSGLNEYMIRDIMDLYKIPKQAIDFGCTLV